MQFAGFDVNILKCAYYHFLFTEEQLMLTLKKTSTLFPLTSSNITRNTFLSELQFIIDKTPLPPHSQLDQAALSQIAEANSYICYGTLG
jgi:hypothetical protein